MVSLPPTDPVSPEMMLPDLLARHPQARGVFDRYGLSGCGGRLGPHESIRFFARAHGVDEPQLLRELQEAIAAGPDPAPDSAPATAAAPALAPAPAPGVADTIYRRYFTAGILAILTAGATWGAWLLWQIGFAGKFTGVSIHHVNAHGHAQIIGWVGLFIMGFGYQAFPRIWHTTLAAPRLAVAAFGMMLAGLVAGTFGMTLAGQWSLAVPVALTAAGLELLATMIFAGQILATFRKSGAKLEPYVGFVVMALFWFVAANALAAWHTLNTMTAPDRETLLWYVKAYQAPLRDLQIHGLALFMILGVSLRMLPGLFELPKIGDRRAWAALAVLTLGVVGEVGVFLAYAWTGNHVIAAFLMLPWVLLTVGVLMVALPWRLWRPLPPVGGMEGHGDRSAKFIRAAYGWLAVSLVMLLLFPGYHAIAGQDFSHAYYGAIRHAITVGFISLMIMGFAAKVVPTLNGVDPRTLTALWGPFVLVNVGCFLRVSLQTLTDFHPLFFALVGVSGVLEVSGLAWWGVGLVRIMRAGKREEREIREGQGPRAKGQGEEGRPGRIGAEHKVAAVLEWFPATEAVFEKYGFGAIRNPVLRRTLARQVTLGQAAGMHRVDAAAFVRDLNVAAGLGVALPQAEAGPAPACPPTDCGGCAHESRCG